VLIMFEHALVAVAVTCLHAQAQPSAPTFRTATHLRVQTVSVKDKSGHPIQGLTAKDFVVTEDGVAQQIAFVAYQPLDGAPQAHLPAVSADAPGLPPVATFDEPVPSDDRYRGRRLIILYFDLFSMPFFDQQRMYAGADKYVDKAMSPPDLVGIVAFE